MITYNGDVNYTASDSSFYFRHSRSEQPNPKDHRSHYEMGYELYMFISGKGRYTIEGTHYSLEPYSLLLINPNEVHALQISEDLPYERIVLIFKSNTLLPFLSHGVDFFRSIKYRKLGQGNKIEGDTVRSSGLLDLFVKLRKTLSQSSMESEFIAKCIVVQILAGINEIKEAGSGSQPIQTQKPGINKVNDLLEYINSNLSESLSLDLLSDKFFINKYHMCHLFKEATGYSVNRYISYKRITMADSLMQQGYTPTQACFMCGFNSYSNFYKMYRKLTGKSPRNSSSSKTRPD